MSSDIPPHILEESIQQYEFALKQEQCMEEIIRLSKEEYDTLPEPEEIEEILRISKEEYELALRQEKEIEDILRASKEEPVHKELVREVFEGSNERKLLLSDLLRRIDFLSVTVEGKHIQSILHPIIEHYINTSEICRPDNDPIVRQFLDELYTIPKSRGKKTAITEEVYRLFTS
jgi:hypothetical protein